MLIKTFNPSTENWEDVQATAGQGLVTDTNGEFQSINVKPYKLFVTDLWNASGPLTNPPTATYNDFQDWVGYATWNITRSSTGVYKIEPLDFNTGTPMTIFQADKTFCIITNVGDYETTPDNYVARIHRATSSSIKIYTWKNGTLTDGLLFNTKVEIRLYN